MAMHHHQYHPYVAASQMIVQILPWRLNPDNLLLVEEGGILLQDLCLSKFCPARCRWRRRLGGGGLFNQFFIHWVALASTLPRFNILLLIRFL
jgi:hypothetical protein